MRYLSIRPCKKAGDLTPTVTDLRAIQYNPSGIINYKLSFDDDWTELPHRPQVVISKPKPRLFNERIKITTRKYNDLQELKEVLPADCHSFYDLMPH